MRRRLPLLLSCLVLAVILGACRSNASTETTADDPGATTPAPSAQDDGDGGRDEDGGDDEDVDGPFDDPSAGGDRAPDEPRTVPPLQLPATAPGTNEAAEALLDELDQYITEDQRAAGVPWPDLRNVDPVESYRSDATFQAWMTENNPTPTLVEAYTAPGGPERDFDLELFDEQNRLDLRVSPGEPPYSMRVEDVVHPAATGISDALLELVPEGSVAIIYWDSVGASDTFTAEGQYYGSSGGWVDLGPWVAIMAPTDVGWQVWYDELVEPPPPGSREQQGPPVKDESPRPQV